MSRGLSVSRLGDVWTEAEQVSQEAAGVSFGQVDALSRRPEGSSLRECVKDCDVPGVGREVSWRFGESRRQRLGVSSPHCDDASQRGSDL